MSVAKLARLKSALDQSALLAHRRNGGRLPSGHVKPQAERLYGIRIRIEHAEPLRWALSGRQRVAVQYLLLALLGPTGLFRLQPPAHASRRSRRSGSALGRHSRCAVQSH
jgi:hypothetical protein